MLRYFLTAWLLAYLKHLIFLPFSAPSPVLHLNLILDLKKKKRILGLKKIYVLKTFLALHGSGQKKS